MGGGGTQLDSVHIPEFTERKGMRKGTKSDSVHIPEFTERDGRGGGGGAETKLDSDHIPELTERQRISDAGRTEVLQLTSLAPYRWAKATQPLTRSAKLRPCCRKQRDAIAVS